jgi:hypothetical protein
VTSTFSYSGDPSFSDNDQVRYWLQDVYADRPLFSDEEIAFEFSLYKDKYALPQLYTAGQLARTICARWAREVAVSADGVSVALSALLTQYQTLATVLCDRWAQMDSEGVVDWTRLTDLNIPDYTIDPLQVGIGWTDSRLAGQQHWGYIGEGGPFHGFEPEFLTPGGEWG